MSPFSPIILKHVQKRFPFISKLELRREYKRYGVPHVFLMAYLIRLDEDDEVDMRLQEFMVNYFNVNVKVQWKVTGGFIDQRDYGEYYYDDYANYDYRLGDEYWNHDVVDVRGNRFDL